MNKEIKVLASVEATDRPRILCSMSDGSVWSCNLEGKNWVREIPSHQELTELFRTNVDDRTYEKNSIVREAEATKAEESDPEVEPEPKEEGAPKKDK